MNTLSEYLKSRGMTQEAFAAAIDSRQATVSRLVNGLQRPSIDLALVIERATNGAVPVSAWGKDAAA